mmetsp:Transcript_74564/g.205602  ORF Transcript_74564/g.205602 Transcript_74564/m.205602 type:complete len:275 (-) Transcript_74564:1041-1865(-)
MRRVLHPLLLVGQLLLVLRSYGGLLGCSLLRSQSGLLLALRAQQQLLVTRSGDRLLLLELQQGLLLELRSHSRRLLLRKGQLLLVLRSCSSLLLLVLRARLLLNGQGLLLLLLVRVRHRHLHAVVQRCGRLPDLHWGCGLHVSEQRLLHRGSNQRGSGRRSWCLGQHLAWSLGLQRRARLHRDQRWRLRLRQRLRHHGLHLAEQRRLHRSQGLHRPRGRTRERARGRGWCCQRRLWQCRGCGGLRRSIPWQRWHGQPWLRHLRHTSSPSRRCLR